jgi:dCMP deaminase
MEDRWDEKFMGLARHLSTWGKDRSRNVACVIVGPNHEIRSTGYAGIPRGLDDTKEARHKRPAKYLWSEHAERNALYNAARVGIPVEGCTIYIPWYPCMDCARGVLQSGISRLVATEPDWNDKVWGEQFAVVREMFEEIGYGPGTPNGGIRVDFMAGPSMGAPK